MIVKIREKNQITLPTKIVKELGLKPGDTLEVEVNNIGQIILNSVSTVTKYEMEELRLVLNDIAEGKVSDAYTANELIKKLGLG